MARNIYSTVYHGPWNLPNEKVWDCKIVKIEYYSANCSENLYHHHLCACAKPFWVVLKIGLHLEKFFLQNGLLTHPLISWNSTNSKALSKIKVFSQICVKNHISYVTISSHSCKSVSKFFINDLRQNLLNLVFGTTLIWYYYLIVGTVQWIISSQIQTIRNNFNEIRTYQ